MTLPMEETSNREERLCLTLHIGHHLRFPLHMRLLIWNCLQERPDAGVVSRLKSEDSDPALFHAGSYSPTVFPPKVAVQA